MKEIKITDIENINIGNAEDFSNATGVTAIICKNGAPCGVDIRGGGPASRETQLLNPVAAAEKIHAVVLSGGSAFGLESASGVMQYLEKKNIGFDTGIKKVPLVCASCIYDLQIKNFSYPDKKMGYLAAKNAFKNIFSTGNAGVGTGATVGKLMGVDYMMKSGLGTYAVEVGALKIGAIVAVNALGDIYENGKIIAGLLSKDKNSFNNTCQTMYKNYEPVENLFTSNTTIGVIVTNAKFNKTQMNKIAQMAHCAYARAIKPVNTTADGDSIYAMSVGEIEADLNVAGTLAADVMENAIINAVKCTKSKYGLKCASDLI